jgi:hypothetical protein
MPGPVPTHQPTFPADFLEPARQRARCRTVRFQLRQRAQLVLLLHRHPPITHAAAAQHVQLHPDSVRAWRHRWDRGDFTLEDYTGRGRKPVFSPLGTSHRQSHRL